MVVEEMALAAGLGRTGRSHLWTQCERKRLARGDIRTERANARRSTPRLGNPESVPKGACKKARKTMRGVRARRYDARTLVLYRRPSSHLALPFHRSDARSSPCLLYPCTVHWRTHPPLNLLSTGSEWSGVEWEPDRPGAGGGGDGEVAGAHGAFCDPCGVLGGMQEAPGTWEGARDGRKAVGEGGGGGKPSFVVEVELELHALEEHALHIGRTERSDEELAASGRRRHRRTERRRHPSDPQREAPTVHCRRTVPETRADQDLGRVPPCAAERSDGALEVLRDQLRQQHAPAVRRGLLHAHWNGRLEKNLQEGCGPQSREEAHP
eukprot:scaffold2858_cov659-Pavlova_lutheri.AAC.63